MPSYTLEELIKIMEPQARRDKALIDKCIDGLGLYAARIAAEDRHSPKIEEIRTLVETLVGYWGLDDSEYYAKAKPLDDYLRAFDERVHGAGTGGAITGDILQIAPNVFYGLHRYGTEMAFSQGADAMGAILDMSDLMKEIAAYWDFESYVLDGLIARLEGEVRGMLDNTTLPGRPVSGIVNVGYEITQAVMFDNGLGFALAHHPDAPSPFVTWRFGVDGEGGNWYEWGNYFSTESRAKIDYIDRVGEYTERYGVKPIRTAVVEANGNHGMIVAVPGADPADVRTRAEAREPAPETLPDAKPSVLKQIREAKSAPKAPRKQKTPGKNKNNVER